MIRCAENDDFMLYYDVSAMLGRINQLKAARTTAAAKTDPAMLAKMYIYIYIYK
jgi:hypothetical protein